MQAIVTQPYKENELLWFISRHNKRASEQTTINRNIIDATKAFNRRTKKEPEFLAFNENQDLPELKTDLEITFRHNIPINHFIIGVKE